MVPMESRLDEIMISDPIIGTDIPNAFQTMTGANKAFSVIRLTDNNSDSLWSIGRWDRGALGITRKYWYGELIAKELFAELLMDNYPDYLEWFLFHPEWL